MDRRIIYLSVHHLSEDDLMSEIKDTYKQHVKERGDKDTTLEILLGVSIKQDTKTLERFLKKMTNTKRLLYMIYAAHSDEALTPIEIQELINDICKINIHDF